MDRFLGPGLASGLDWSPPLSCLNHFLEPAKSDSSGFFWACQHQSTSSSRHKRKILEANMSIQRPPRLDHGHKTSESATDGTREVCGVDFPLVPAPLLFKTINHLLRNGVYVAESVYGWRSDRPGRSEEAASESFPDSSWQIPQEARLENIPAGIQFYCAGDQIRVFKHTQKHNLRLGFTVPQALRRLHPAQAGHFDVQNQDIRIEANHRLNRGIAAVHGCEDIALFHQNIGHERTHQVAIIGDDKAWFSLGKGIPISPALVRLHPQDSLRARAQSRPGFH